VVVRARRFAVNGFAVLFDGHVELALFVIGVPSVSKKPASGAMPMAARALLDRISDQCRATC